MRFQQVRIDQNHSNDKKWNFLGGGWCSAYIRTWEKRYFRVDPVSFFRTIVFSRKRFILTKAFSKTLLKKRNWKLSKAFLSQRKRNWHFTNPFLTELKRFRNLSKASQTKLKIVNCVFVRFFSTTKCVSVQKRFNFQKRFQKRFWNLSIAFFSNWFYKVALKLSEAFLSRKRFRFKCVFSITFGLATN